MKMFGCPCCATLLCQKEGISWREDVTSAPAGYFIDDRYSVDENSYFVDGPFLIENAGLDFAEPDFAPGPVFADTIPGGISSSAVISEGGHVEVDIETLGDHDWYRVTLTAGQTYTIHTSSISGQNTDAFINLRSSTGALILSDDDSGDGINSLISYTPTTTEVFYIDAGTFNDGSTGRFRLSVSTFPSSATDIVENVSSTATLAVGGGINGTLCSVGDRDYYRINLVAGQTYLFRTGSTTAVTDTTAVDTILTLRDASGVQLLTNDDAGEYVYSGIRLTATTTGTYFLVVSGFGSATGQLHSISLTTDPLVVE